MDLLTDSFTTLAKSTLIEIDPEMISVPEAIEFDSDVTKSYGLYYRPNNKHYVGPQKEKPPLLVKAHGGPTGIASTALNLEIQYWTSRGFAVLDVNYRGSTGFGRTYRERLYGEWGAADVDDCVNGALYLVLNGEVHPEKLVISGGSAGGFTVLCAATFTNAFKAGASYYGICDLEAMAHDTHKFESRYLENLVGPLAKKRALYRSRSPLYSAQRLSSPLIFFQGLEDKIVPPNQTTLMVDALKKRGLPVACILYEGEQHGFRRAETIRRSLDAELYFYSRILNFRAPADIQPVEIFNLPDSQD
jgi:dipeptidyl aminopeptidase/acylaminoacyl peptidase